MTPHAMPRPRLLPAPLRARLRPVCVAVTGCETVSLFTTAEKALQQSSFIEIRLDALEDPAGAVARLRIFCAAHPEAAVLTTCRRVEGGGAFSGSATHQLKILAQCARAGALLVDVELETLESTTPERLSAFHEELMRAGAFLLASAHDFDGTGDLRATLERLRTAGAPAHPEIYKVVSTAQTLTDNLSMLRFLKAVANEIPLVGICMGIAGLPSRVLALRAGALFTFASVEGGDPTASGQVTARVLLEQYRAAELTERTRIYGLAGNPVTHSLSPALHNAAFRAAGVDAVYLPLHTTSVADLLTSLDGLDVAGLSITMPWKVAMYEELLASTGNAIHPDARGIRAINTLVRRADGSLLGANTDNRAITEPLLRRIPLAGARILLLGAGGAARAAVFGLQALGGEVTILNRSKPAAAQLARESGAHVADSTQLDGFAVIVNATPVGMHGQQPQEPLLNERVLQQASIVFDMVYRPRETALLRMARSLGIEVSDGLEMFLEQGAQQWTLWTGQPPPVEAMQQALETALALEDVQRT